MKFSLYRLFTFFTYNKVVNLSYLTSLITLLSPEVVFRKFEIYITATFINSHGEKEHRHLRLVSKEEDVTPASKYGVVVNFPSLNLTYKFLLDSRVSPKPFVYVNTKDFNIFKALGITREENLVLDDFIIQLFIEDDQGLYKVTPVVILDKRDCPLKR